MGGGESFCGKGRVVAGQGGVAVNEFDVLASAAVGRFHDSLYLAVERAAGRVVVAFAVREAGLGFVGVSRGCCGGHEVEGMDVGQLSHLADYFRLGGEGAEELLGTGGLNGADGGVDGGEVCDGWAGLDGPVEEDDAGDVEVREYGDFWLLKNDLVKR